VASLADRACNEWSEGDLNIEVHVINIYYAKI